MKKVIALSAVLTLGLLGAGFPKKEMLQEDETFDHNNYPFISEDGVQINKGDEYWCASEESLPNPNKYTPESWSNRDEDSGEDEFSPWIKRFSTKEKADEYIRVTTERKCRGK